MSEDRTEPAYACNGQSVTAAEFYAMACDPRRHVAVEACAGAGKTWMLVSRIVRALLDNACAVGQAVQPHEILAITFTKRAAAEMRERLHEWLQYFAVAPPALLQQELQARGMTSAQASPEVAQALADLYRRLLGSGREVQIRTFHSWFAALLRVAPLAVLERFGLPYNYELLEDDAQARAQVWRRFYQCLVERPALRLDFEGLVFDYGRSQIEKALAAALDKRVEFALADASGSLAQSVSPFAPIYPALGAFEEPLQCLHDPALRQRWLAWAGALGREANKTPRAAASWIEQAFANVASDGVAAALAPSEQLALLREALFVKTEDRLAHHLTRFAAAREAAAELTILCGAVHQHGAWVYQQRMVRLTRLALDEYAALKRDRGWVDMPDVERCARLLLSDPVLSGWVQERLDGGVRHLLIDEFQDTNPLQWQALSSWLASYSGAGGRAPSVFLVGDPKQSIYRFRRAEPQVFRAAQEFVRNGLGGDLLSCDHTRRNAPPVISAVNAVMLQDAVAARYAGFRVHTTASNAAGQVLSLPLIPRPAVRRGRAAESDAETLDDSGTWRDSLTQARQAPDETLRQLEARQVALWLAQQVAAGTAAKDCMVLSRRRSGLLPLQEALRDLGVPAVIGEKTELIDCCEVQDMVALVDLLVSPGHDLSLARVLRSPLFGVPDAALVALALRRRVQASPWFELLAQPWPCEHVLHGVAVVLQRWQVWVRQLPPHDALQAIYLDGDVLAKYAAVTPAALRADALANLRALLGAALDINGGRFPSAYAFVRALKAGGVLAPEATRGDAVRLLTIHGAKGLEADTVVVVDTDTAPRAADTMAVLVDWPAEAAAPQRLVFLASERRPPVCAAQVLQTEVAQRQREELNALYVAMTRARRTLVFSAIAARSDAPASWWRLFAGASPQPTAALAPPDDATTTLDGLSDAFAMQDLPSLAPAPPDSADAAAGVRESNDDTVSSRVGQALHRLLEWGDIGAAACAAAAREFALDGMAAVNAVSMARRILDGEGAWVWDNKLLDWQGNEVDLQVDGRVVRLDRLVRRRDTGHWWVLDYKSAAVPERQESLLLQLQSYRDAVQRVYPCAVVRAAFLGGQGALIEPAAA